MQLGATPKQIELLEEDAYPAVVAAIQDLGMKPNTFEPGKDQHRIMIYFLFAETDKEGQPFYVRRELTNSMHQKAALRKLVGQIIGKDAGDKPIDDTLILDKQVVVTVEHQEGKDGRIWMKAAHVKKQKDANTQVEIPKTWKPPTVRDFTKGGTRPAEMDEVEEDVTV